jgi:hypothetical protein
VPARSSSAPYEAHDFVIVAILNPNLGESRARDHFEISLYGNADRIEADLADKVGDRDAAFDAAVLAVDPDLKR